MAQAQVSVTVEIGFLTDGSAVLNSVKDAMGNDVTEDFRQYAKKEKVDLTSQGALETAAGDYAKAKQQILP